MAHKPVRLDELQTSWDVMLAQRDALSIGWAAANVRVMCLAFVGHGWNPIRGVLVESCAIARSGRRQAIPRALPSGVVKPGPPLLM
jgi:hypothetical protein